MGLLALHACRHPELVLGSISPLNHLGRVARWMLKHVQRDEVNGI